MSEKDMQGTAANIPEEENSDRAMEALFKALEESGQLEGFLENQRRIEEIAQAAVLGMHSDPATPDGRDAIERAAELGDCHCQLKIAIVYGDGEFVPPDYEKSLYYFEKAAQENNSSLGQYYAAQYYAGLIDESMPTDFDRAVDYLKMAVKGDDADIARDAEELLNKIHQFRQHQKDAQAQVQQQKKGCYIATAVYGSYDCPQVWVLRRFRDEVLAGKRLGRVFIRCYYAISPALVRRFGKNPGFTCFWKKKLDALVDHLQARGIQNSHYQD